MFKIYTSTLIYNENREVLLVTEKKEANFQKINFPGGHLEEGETPMQGAIRETIEETGLEILLTGLVGIYLGRSHPSFHYIFAGTVTGGTLHATTEVLDARWYSYEELLALPKEVFVYQEKLFDVINLSQTQALFPIETIIRDLKKI